MSNIKTIPEDVVQELIKVLMQKVDKDGNRIYSNDQIYEIIAKLQNLTENDKIQFKKKLNISNE